MNVTELARKLGITPNKLREILPQLGFDIGARAVKIDPKTARTIIDKLSDPKLRAKYLENKNANKDNSRIIIDDGSENSDDKKEKIIRVPEKIVVKQLAKRMQLPVTNLIMELMKNGVMATLNQDIDFDTAAIIAEDMGYQVEKSDENNIDLSDNKISKILSRGQGDCSPRPPVVVVMGHVDHGKTKLLDAIRETNVVEGEAGGITQHIGAYQAEKDGRILTFIDTPGHEAFSAMRSRGARVADIAILVVAADDGVQPQTVEAISHIKNAELPFLVAINKIDKPEANVDKIKGDLANIGLTPEDWGGKTVCVQISAKEKININELLDTLFLIADLHQSDIVAVKQGLAAGTIVESYIDKGEGPVATVLVQTGTLKQGDLVKIGNVPGKIRMMKNWVGEQITEAIPSMPVRILGLKKVPQVGDILEVVPDKKSLRSIEKIKHKPIRDMGNVSAPGSEIKDSSEEEEEKPRLKLMIKTDVLGSHEAIADCLEKVDQSDVDVVIIKKGLGNITEADIEQADSLGAKLIGFNVKTTREAETIAVDSDTNIMVFNVIYDLVEFVEKEMLKLAGKKIIRSLIAKVNVLAVFANEKNFQVVGGEVIFGTAKQDSFVYIKRKDEVVAESRVLELESGKVKVNEVASGQKCGLKTEGSDKIETGDLLELYVERDK